MIINEVVEILKKYTGIDKIDFISGEILNVGTANCKLSGKNGSVYGIAIKLEDNEVENYFREFNEKGINHEDWESIGNNFYPLYWGKDQNMGSRLYAHIKSPKGTGSLQLNNRGGLENREIIYGAVPCLNSDKIEKLIRKNYPDILKTKNG